MRTSDFYYDLPEELIAQHPIDDRTASRLLALDGTTGTISHHSFKDLDRFLRPGDVLVINNTRVIPARLLGSIKDSGRAIELLLLKRIDEKRWETLARPGKKVRPGKRLVFIENVLEAVVEDVKEDGNRIIAFEYEGVWEEVLDRAGIVPLPPYIHEQLEDKERYQTVYALAPGSSAAPTAGLHFTKDLLNNLNEKGVEIAEVTLHVGLGTFRPVKSENIEDHLMHSEWFDFPEDASDKVRRARKEGRRIVAVGTTSCRTLESVAQMDPDMRPCSGYTSIFIYPGYDFHCVDALVTNFHLPESTLIMMVSAFAGKDNVFRAYNEAVQERYRFFSFGDAMFLTKRQERG
ncbi:MAG TPA: tRNA preQ1(34) S-adenosylmethionine ribosyltransferase-isomerase QueA [Clostridiaceae bacterium]|nr:tRNA preQ1(34) S-adenosylmethionine ribosyltransferase-isomerase QueA [Clostridiaceae bacterium]